MSMIDVQNLTFCYDGGIEPIFQNVSFRIDTDWKTGFVGRNGKGKTTFLHLLEGKYEYGGAISASVKFTYFPFEVSNASALCAEIVSDICPEAEEWEVMREMSCLELDAGVLYRPLSELSHGERAKLLLAALFLKDNNFLLIDEPTNHLDARARKVVAAYLKRKKGFIVVSHDRAFLDGCIDHVLSLTRSGVEIAVGNFSTYLENFERRQSFETAQNERLKKEISRLESSARRTASWADRAEHDKYGKADSGLKKDKGYVGHKAAKVMQRAGAVKTRLVRDAAQKSELLHDVESTEKLKLSPLSHRAERLLSATDLEIFYGDLKVCSLPRFELLRGERVALVGKNGSGKSSIIKLIAGTDIAHGGSLALASGLIVSYVPQHTDGLSGNVKEFAANKKIDDSLFMAILDKMDFPSKYRHSDIRALSEGQRKKLLLAASLCERAHLYVWDEPLNYIDVYSRIQIENLIKEYAPTMLFVEHDVSFLSAIATRTVEL